MDAAIAALKAGLYDEVEDALRTGQVKPKKASLLLHIAVIDNSTEAVRLLLRHGARPSPLETYQFGKCHTLEIFKLLTQYKWRAKKEEVRIIPELYEHLDIVDWLLDNGKIDVNSTEDLVLKGNIYRPGLRKGEYDHTIGLLNEAARAGKPAAFDYLVSRGADPSRCLALHYAAEFESENSAKVEAVIDHFVEKYRFDVNNDEWTCGGLMKVGCVLDAPRRGPPLRPAVYSHNIPALRALLRHGADAERVVRTAISLDDMEILRLLLEAGVDATEACDDAGFFSNIDAIRLCLEYGADPEPALQANAARVAENDMATPLTDEMRTLLQESKIHKLRLEKRAS